MPASVTGSGLALVFLLHTRSQTVTENGHDGDEEANETETHDAHQERPG